MPIFSDIGSGRESAPILCIVLFFAARIDLPSAYSISPAGVNSSFFVFRLNNAVANSFSSFGGGNNFFFGLHAYFFDEIDFFFNTCTLEKFGFHRIWTDGDDLDAVALEFLV